MTHPALQLVGNIHVDPAVSNHRFVKEALACAMFFASEDELPHAGVIGTENSKTVELYGWAPHVREHSDNTGFVYLLALNEGTTTVNVWEGDTPHSVWLPAGAVIRLNDFTRHWTEDSGPRVCAFIGSFEEPCDDLALAQLEAAVSALVRGDYYGAPRVKEGFRVMLEDECLVADAEFDGHETMLLDDAKDQDRFILECAECGKPAIVADSKWPHFWEDNRCRDHLKRTS